MLNIQYPVPYQKISLAEAQNNIGINVFGYEGNKITLLHVSEREGGGIINLLLLAQEHNHALRLNQKIFAIVRRSDQT